MCRRPGGHRRLDQRERLDRLPDRTATDAELRGEFVLRREARTWLELPREDELLDARDGPISDSHG